MKIEFSKYILTPKKQLNSFSNIETRNGVLFKVDDKYFIDYHPWLEFGDINCDEMISSIKSQGLNGFLMYLLDLEKNQDQIEKTEFKNHSSLEGDVLKIKAIGSVKDIVDKINSYKEIKLRIDFNNHYSASDIKTIWEKINNKNLIDYFEDPLLYDQEIWLELNKLGIPLASDRNPKNIDFVLADIYKPNIELDFETKNLKIFSSYMGHDIGRYHCYLALMSSKPNEQWHGIDTPDIYEEQLNLFYTNNGKTYLDTNIKDQLYIELEKMKWTQI